MSDSLFERLWIYVYYYANADILNYSVLSAPSKQQNAPKQHSAENLPLAAFPRTKAFRERRFGASVTAIP